MKFGFGQCIDHVCYDLRDNLMDRKTAIDLVLKYDRKCAEKYIDKFCNYIQISKDEFIRIADYFRDPRVWKFKDDKWIAPLRE